METFIEITDCDTITEVLKKAFMTVAINFGFTKENAPRFPAFIAPEYIEKQLNSGLKIFGHYIEDQIAGCAGYSYYKDQIYFIERLAVLPEYRHMGIGRKLMEFAENKIRENNGKIAEIHVIDKNTILREWYKNLGYHEIRTDELKSMPYNSVVMIKEL